MPFSCDTMQDLEIFCMRVACAGSCRPSGQCRQHPGGGTGLWRLGAGVLDAGADAADRSAACCHRRPQTCRLFATDAHISFLHHAVTLHSCEAAPPFYLRQA